jgi:Calcineurin-like phosphoesterase
MRIQLLSDLHLETESVDPRPAPGADVLVLAGDIDSTWRGLEAFAAWPVPVIVVPGNHEFDGREMALAEAALRARCESLGMQWLHRQQVVLADRQGRRVRFVGAIRWSDFDVLGLDERPRAMKAGAYFARCMKATSAGQPVDTPMLRDMGLACRRWLQAALTEPRDSAIASTVVITHFAPSLRSADPRFGHQPSTASFCNADDDLIPLADLWLHGHLHYRCDYSVERAGALPTRVLCNARGLARKRECDGWNGMRLIEACVDAV